MLFLKIKEIMARIPRKRNYKTETQYDPKIHTKTKGGHGFGMKKGVKAKDYESSGLHLIEVFKWKVPEHLKEEYEKFKEANA